jgi:pantoate--beta-alanine ligase
MRLYTSVGAMQRQALAWRRRGTAIGFVPTMGNLHAGHLELTRIAKRKVGRNGRVVVSIFVNPLQFGPREDFAKYPRTLAHDLALCRREPVDAVFVPTPAEMYPAGTGPFSTFVVEEELSRLMEGKARPTHFRGVTTVVAKLFNLVLPTVAVFGAKDFQQAAIVQRMVRDLSFPLAVVVAPTVREPDGLALSSRNQYLSVRQRKQATVLSAALQLARAIVRRKRDITANQLRSELTWFIEMRPQAQLQYIEFFDPVTLARVRRVRRGHQMALAVWLGKTRLIDNGRL